MNAFSRVVSFVLGVLVFVASGAAAERPNDVIRKVGSQRGIVCLLDLPDNNAKYPVELAEASQLTIYFQSADAGQVLAVRQAAEAAGLLGSRVFVDSGPLNSIHLADNIADAVLVAASAVKQVSDEELLRAL